MVESYKPEGFGDYMDAKNVLSKLFKDNEAFAGAHSDGLEAVQSGQSPKVTAVFCADSRVNERSFAEEPFNYLFVIQNAGNVARINAGSVWYGVDHLKTPVLAVIGHTGCGAVYAAMDDPDHLPEDLRQIGEVVRRYRDGAPGDRLKANAYFVEKNVDEEVSWLLQQDWARDALVVGLVYDLNGVLSDRGRVRLTNYNGRTDEQTLRSTGLPYGRVAP